MKGKAEGARMLDILVLGSVKARTGDRDHPLGGAKQRALLARLVIARGRPVSPHTLIAELWDESPPRNAVHALQSRISRLRSAVPAGVELSDGGYRLDHNIVQTDSARFESLYQDGSRLLTQSSPALAAEYLHQALALWRGHAFEGIPKGVTLQTESVRLEKLHAGALADRIDVDLALGDHAAVVPELHALVEEQPFAERHWGQLMMALYCDGRPQEALEVFSQARELFADRLGIEPSSDLGQLHTGILREESPTSLLRLPVATPVLDAAAQVAAGLGQAPIRALTSNQHDDLAGLLHHHQAMLLTGPAGIGKTHLLRALRARLEAQHCSAPLLTASPLVHTVPLGVFAGAGSMFFDDKTTPSTLIDHFARQRSTTVLLVDNVDQLDDASLFVVTQLLRNSQVPAIVTSRTLAGAPDEIRALYDGGEVAEIMVENLSSDEADMLITQMLGSPLTPSARPAVLEAAAGNPLHLREIVAASQDEGRLVRTQHGWELRGLPASSSRLTEVIGERFGGLDETVLEAAAQVAIAGEYPAAALESPVRRALARAGVVAYSAHGWLRLAHPLDGEFLRHRCSEALLRDLTQEVVGVLLSDVTSDWPAARRRAHILALDVGQPVDVSATIAVAEHALGAFDERLALRAAEAVACQVSENVAAHRIAALAASSLGMPEVADTHIDHAHDNATTAEERASVALAHARHLGLGHHDAVRALDVLQKALQTVDDPAHADHLRRDAMRWAVVAGQGAEVVDAPGDATDTAAVLGLITVAASGVITGPLREAERTLLRLRSVSAEFIERVPGGASLIELTEIMALSNTGDLIAARHRLRKAITAAQTHSPETLGMWEYALGFSELLSGDLERCYALATSASEHLQWRDITGLLPAARALAGAAACATGRADVARKQFEAVPEPADNDPKVVMLRAWADARTENTGTGGDRASRILLETARWLLTAQHTYFAGMLAHCAVRLGRDLDDAIAVLREARHIAGGGLLDLFCRHGEATIAGDLAELAVVADDAQELGIFTTAADTWIALSQVRQSGQVAERHTQRWRPAAQSDPEARVMALWATPAR